MPSTNEVLNVLRTIAAMNTTAFGLEVAGTATLDELQIPGSAYIGLVTQLRDAVHSASAPLPSARELLDGMKLDPFFSLEEVAGRFCRAVATAPPVCPDMALPGTPDDEDCRFWRNRSFRCRILRSIQLWSRRNDATLTMNLGNLIPGDFSTAQLVALVEMTKTQAVFGPRSYSIVVPHGVDGNSTGHDYAAAIWDQQPAVTESCHFVSYEGPVT